MVISYVTIIWAFQEILGVVGKANFSRLMEAFLGDSIFQTVEGPTSLSLAKTQDDNVKSIRRIRLILFHIRIQNPI